MTDSEKERRINQLYVEKTGYIEKQGKYQAALRHASEVLQELQDLGKKIKSIQEVVYDNFVIKGVPGDAGRLEILITGLGELYSFLSGNCTNAIENEIRKLNEKIASCDSQMSVIQSSK